MANPSDNTRATAMTDDIDMDDVIASEIWDTLDEKQRRERTALSTLDAVFTLVPTDPSDQEWLRSRFRRVYGADKRYHDALNAWNLMNKDLDREDRNRRREAWHRQYHWTCVSDGEKCPIPGCTEDGHGPTGTVW